MRSVPKAHGKAFILDHDFLHVREFVQIGEVPGFVQAQGPDKDKVTESCKA